MAFGIPPLLNQIANVTNIVSLIFTDAVLIYQKFLAPSWGIHNANNGFAIIPDSIVSVDYNRSWTVASYPMEQGSFQSYNKIQMPFEHRVQMTKGGTVSERQDFLNRLESIAASLDLYDIVTPEKTYHNVNIENINYVRTSTNGIGLLTVEVSFVEVRITATAQFSNVQSSSARDPVSIGTVQPQTPLQTPIPL